MCFYVLNFVQYLMFYFDSDSFVSLTSPLRLSRLCTALFHGVFILPHGYTLSLGFFIALRVTAVFRRKFNEFGFLPAYRLRFHKNLQTTSSLVFQGSTFRSVQIWWSPKTLAHDHPGPEFIHSPPLMENGFHVVLSTDVPVHNSSCLLIVLRVWLHLNNCTRH